MSFLFLLFPSLLISYFHLSFQVFKCPLCKKSFEKRPDLQINRTLREITDQYKSMKNGVVKNKSGRKGTGGHGSPSSHLFDELKKKLRHPVRKTHQTFSRSKKTSVFPSVIIYRVLFKAQVQSGGVLRFQSRQFRVLGK